MKVFIVDDSAVVRARMLILLSELEGVEIIGQASDARTAVDKIERLKPDVVILDIQLHGMNGIYVLQKAKQCDPAPVVIMLTNYPYLQFREKSIQAGADYFFDKSTEFDKVAEVLKEKRN